LVELLLLTIIWPLTMTENFLWIRVLFFLLRMADGVVLLFPVGVVEFYLMSFRELLVTNLKKDSET
jgi:hypothetical protein